MAAGRPKEGLGKLPKSWKQQMLDLYENGGSDTEVKALIYKWRGSFSNDLWDRWMIEEPDFSESVKVGRKMAEAWWLSMGRSNLMVDPEGPKLNATLWYMNMKNRYKWADKQENTHSGPDGGAIKTDNTFKVEFVNADAEGK